MIHNTYNQKIIRLKFQFEGSDFGHFTGMLLKCFRGFKNHYAGRCLNVFLFVLLVSVSFLALSNFNEVNVSTTKKTHIIVFPSFDENLTFFIEPKDLLNKTLLRDFYRNQAQFTKLKDTFKTEYDEYYKTRLKHQEYTRNIFEEIRLSFPNYQPSCPAVPGNLIGFQNVKEAPLYMNAISNKQNTIPDLKYVELGKLLNCKFFFIFSEINVLFLRRLVETEKLQSSLSCSCYFALSR